MTLEKVIRNFHLVTALFPVSVTDIFFLSILDLPIGKTDITNNAVMVNLVGENNTKGPVVYKNLDQLIGIKGVNPHIYGKKQTHPNRKMGHVTIIE